MGLALKMGAGEGQAADEQRHREINASKEGHADYLLPGRTFGQFRKPSLDAHQLARPMPMPTDLPSTSPTMMPSGTAVGRVRSTVASITTPGLNKPNMGRMP